jgi:hypothetical protein
VVEQGLVMLVQQGLAAQTPPVSVPGGYAVELPKDCLSAATPQAWSWRSIASTPEFVLKGQTGWTEWVVQVDCHGFQSHALAITLARAIDKVLRGVFQGVLPDPDNTYVFGIYRQPPVVDGYSDVNRSFVRSLEYRVIYQQI